jgi:hypothetical protein
MRRVLLIRLRRWREWMDKGRTTLSPIRGRTSNTLGHMMSPVCETELIVTVEQLTARTGHGSGALLQSACGLPLPLLSGGSCFSTDSFFPYTGHM